MAKTPEAALSLPPRAAQSVKSHYRQLKLPRIGPVSLGLGALCAARWSAAYELLHLHAWPHLQASPHGQVVALGSALRLWHPHWQTGPAQGLHEHWVELDIGLFSFRFD